MIQPQVELSYERAHLPWYRRRRVQRGLILAAILIAGIWAINASGPIWARYRYYRLQQQAATYKIDPSRGPTRYSATQPNIHVPGTAVSLVGEFWKARRDSHLVSIDGATQPTCTHIFFGLRTTKHGRPQIVDIYSGVFTTGGITELWIVIATTDLQGCNWILTGHPTLPGNNGSIGVACGNFHGRLGPTADITLFNGTPNANDPSEVDVRCVANGRSDDLKFRVLDPIQPSGDATVEIEAYSQKLTDFLQGWSAVNVWDWPFTADKRSP